MVGMNIPEHACNRAAGADNLVVLVIVGDGTFAKFKWLSLSCSSRLKTGRKFCRC